MAKNLCKSLFSHVPQFLQGLFISVALIAKHTDNLHELGTSIITSRLPLLYGKKRALLKDVDENFIGLVFLILPHFIVRCSLWLGGRLIGGPSPPFPFASAEDYYRWASSHDIAGDVKVPLLVIHAEDDPIVQEIPCPTQESPYVSVFVTPGGGHLGWFESSPSARWFGKPDRWFRRPVLEWLQATAERDLLPLATKPPSPVFESIHGFVSEVGRSEVAYRVISIGKTVGGVHGSGLLAGL